MKKTISAILCIAVLMLVFAGCTKPMNMHNVLDEPNFAGIVTEVAENTITVKVNGDEDVYNSSDTVVVSLDVEIKDGLSDYDVGDEVRVYYDGGIAESFPAQVNNVYAIIIVSEYKAEIDTMSLLAAYYAAQNEPAFDYFQNSSIQDFLSMWVEQALGSSENLEWHLETFTRFSFLNPYISENAAEDLYFCTFSVEGDRQGYLILGYHENDPSIDNRGVVETTPYHYDLAAVIDQAAEALSGTTFDFSSAATRCVSLTDAQGNSGNPAVLFSDANGDNYLWYFGEASALEKLEA